jgi:hypothetical protein
VPAELTGRTIMRAWAVDPPTANDGGTAAAD